MQRTFISSNKRKMALTWVPTTTICGNWIASAPTVLKTFCSLLITGINASIVNGSVGADGTSDSLTESL